MKRIGIVTILLGCSTSILATGQALAQPAEAPKPVGSTEQAAQAANSVIQADPAPREGSLQDIVVTATRQAQNLSKVPISVAAYSQEVLDQQGVRAVDDIARLTPGVTFTRGDYRNGGAANIAIRGISSTAGSATTGIYVDDTPIQIRSVGFSAFTPFPAVFDLERVEVLRGPQGTLFGAGSEGGTVRFITPRPDLDDVRAYGRTELATTASGDASYEAGAALSVPIVTDKIAVRGSGYYRHDGGWIDRVNYLTGRVEEENANSSDTIVLQGAIAFAPTETLTITPSVFYQKLEIDDGNFYWESLSDPGDGVFRNGNPIANTSKDRFVLPALKVEFEAGPVTIVSNTSYFDRKQSAVNDYSTFEAVLWAGTPFFPAGFEAQALQSNSQKNFTQEIRFQNSDADARLNWVVGGFYSRSRQRASQFVEDRFLPALILQNRGVTFEQFFGQPLVQGRYTFVLDEANAVDKQWAGFGQVDFSVTEKLKLTAGVRVAETRFNIAAQFVGPVVGPPVNDVGRQKESPITPKFGISYQADTNNLFYTSAAKGFRSGGYNPAVGLPCGVSAAAPVPGTPLGNIGLANRPTQFGSDSVWSYEVGSKNKLFDRRLQLDASAFRIDWKNIQQSVGLACGFNFTDNLGSARSQGFEIAFQAAVTDAFTLGGSFGHTKAEFKDTVRAGPTAPRNIVTDGDDIVLNPWQVYLNGQYSYGLIGRKGYTRFDYQYQSGQDATVSSRNPLNGSADLTIPGRQGFHTLSLRSGVTFEGVDVSLFVNNLFDSSKQILRQHDIPPSPLFRGTTLRPRTIGLTASYRM
jgi:outer membrane receptor protein involved in Fe transport